MNITRSASACDRARRRVSVRASDGSRQRHSITQFSRATRAVIQAVLHIAAIPVGAGRRSEEGDAQSFPPPASPAVRRNTGPTGMELL